MVLFQQGKIHAGFAVKAVDKGFGNHKAQIFVAFPVFTQQYQVVRIVVNAMDSVGHIPSGHINLTANDGLHTGGLGSFIEIDTAVHDTVVGDGNGRLPQLLHPIHHAVNPAGTVQEAVFGMHM